MRQLHENTGQASYDVVVIGGGLAGLVAAIAASRLGSKVALVQDRPVLGGNSSSEIRVPIGGADAVGRNRQARETGIIEELRLEFGYREPIPPGKGNLHSGNKRVWDMILEEWVEREKNLALFLDSRAVAVGMNTTTSINNVNVHQSGSNKAFTLTGHVFIDATGDGVIAAWAGADFMVGREGREEYGEELAPGSPDTNTLGSSIMFSIRDAGYPVYFHAPSWAAKYAHCSNLPPHKHILDTQMGFWWIEYGGERDTIADNVEIRRELLRTALGVWDHIKNHCTIRHRARDYALDWIAAVVGKRESRRVLGDHVLSQNDLTSRELPADRVAYGGWPIDLHPPLGIDSKTLPAMQLFLPLYSIPFRSLYSSKIENLFVAGRDISATHVALGSTRIMGTCAVIGQAVGTAAHLSCKHNVGPRGICSAHIEELQQQLLKDDCYIIGLKSKDSHDLASNSRVSGSSCLTLKVTCAEEFQELDCARGQVCPISQPHIEKIQLYMKSDRIIETDVRLGLCQVQSLEDTGSQKDVVSCHGTVPPGPARWITFAVNTEVDAGRLYRVWLQRCPKVYWGYTNEELVCTMRSRYDDATNIWEPVLGRQDEEYARWIPDYGTFCFKFIPDQEPYDAANVISGVSRPEVSPHIWISDPSQGFPQYLEFAFPESVNVKAIYVTFDTDLNYHGRPLLQVPTPECVKDYALYRFEAGNWIPIVEVYDNYQRRRIHTLTESISSRKIRLEVRATNGADTARVYEMRMY